MKNKVQVLLWLDEKAWDDDGTSQIFDAFKPLKARKDIKAAIGAGADGLVPALNILLIVTSVVTVGFLSAIGEEVWKLLKQAVLDASKIKPNVRQLGRRTPQNYFEFIWWIHFSDKQILITLSTVNIDEVKKALGSLPEAIDLSLSKNPDFTRLFWVDGSWSSL